MAQTLRRSARIRNKLPQYTDPTTSDDSTSYSSSNDNESISDSSDNDKMHCICNKPQDHRLMICCDDCNIWHHHDCVHLTKSQANKLSKSNKKWHCLSCKKSNSSKKQNNTNKKSKKRKRNTITSNNNIHPSPPHKKHKKNTNTNISPQQQAIRTLFNNLSNKHIHNPCFELPFAPKDTNNELTIENEEEEEEEEVENNENDNTDTDLEILPNDNNNNNNTLSIAPVIAFLLQADKDKHIDTSDSDSDDDIMIEAGDKWIKSESFMENKELFKKEIINKKKENINKYINNIDLKDDKDFVVLNDNKICKQDICPITLKTIICPITNLLCKHRYEKDAIKNYEQYMLKNEKEVTCPQAGCNKYLFISQ